MKKLLLVLIASLGVMSLSAQDKTLPSAKVKTMEGQVIDVQELGKTYHPRQMGLLFSV